MSHGSEWDQGICYRSKKKGEGVISFRGSHWGGDPNGSQHAMPKQDLRAGVLG